jgi:fructose-specific phosphotransferase system IIC component
MAAGFWLSIVRQKRIFKTYKHFTGERSAARAQIFIGVVLILFGIIFFGAESEDIPAYSRYKFVSYFYILPAKILGNIITSGLYVIFGFVVGFHGIKKARELKKQERTFRKWG